MIKGLAITPPVIGRISIGKVIEKQGKRLPEKDDYFTITTQVQNREGWILHALHAKLQNGNPNNKIRAIPIRLMFNSSLLNFRAEYCAFDRNNGRPMCVGNGETAKQVVVEGVKEVKCPSPEHCEYGKKMGCKPYGRLNVIIDEQDDEFGTFIFRTTGYNSIRTLTAKLQYFEAVTKGNTRYLPLQLKLRAKSTTLSHRTPVYYVDLCLRDGVRVEEAVKLAIEASKNAHEAGVEIDGFELAAKAGLENGAFEDSQEESTAIVEEFYPEATAENDPPTPITPLPAPLTNKLATKAAKVA